MKITRESRNLVGTLWGSLGGDPSLDEGEEPIDCCDPGGSPPVDRAADQPIFTVNDPAVGGIVQTKVTSFITGGGSARTENYDDTPTNGNTLYALLFATDGFTVDSAGWTLSEKGTANGDQVALYRKVAGAAEPTGVHIADNGTVGTARLVLYEVAGTFDVDGHTTDDSASSPLTGPSITPSDAPTLLIAAFIGQVATYAGNPTWTPLGGLATDSFQRQSPGRLVSGAYNKALEDTSAVTPSITTTPLYSGRKTATVAWTTLTGDPTSVVWNVEAPNTVDGDDGTYHEIEGVDLLRIDLGGAFRIVRSRIFVGSENAGSPSLTIRGANEADFDDGVILATITYDSTGSFTGDEVELLWDTTASYRYFELTGSSEIRRVYTWELYEPDTSEGEDHTHPDLETEIDTVAETVDEHITDIDDAHDASAISIEDVDDYYTGTTVEEALAEIGAGGIGGGGGGTAFIGCSLTKSAVQAIATGGSGTVITFDGEAFDTDAFHSTSVNTSRITIPAGMGGKYLIGGAISVDSISDAKDFILRFLKNGTVIAIQARVMSGGTSSPSINSTLVVDLAAGDYIEISMQHSHGSDRDCRATSGGTYFWAYKLESGSAGGAIGARVNNSTSTVSAGNTTWTSMTWSAENFDTDAFHDTGSNTSRLTCPAGLAGKYLIVGNIQFAANTTGQRGWRILLNGATVIGGDFRNTEASGSVQTRAVVSAIYDLVPGDYVELQGWQSSGGALNMGGSTDYTWFSIMRLDSGSTGSFYPIPSITNVAGAFSSSSSSCAATFATAPVTGDKLICVIGASGRGANSITQTNVTWTKRYGSSGNSQFFEVWTGVVTGAAGTGITANFTGNNTQQIAAWVWNELPAAPTTGTGLATSTGASRTVHSNEVSLGTGRGGWYIIGRCAAGPTSSYWMCSQEAYAPSAATFGGQLQCILLRGRADRVAYTAVQSSAVNDFGAIVQIA